jgi:trehalose/maltose hydrolase-like predicted phosphorylase
MVTIGSRGAIEELMPTPLTTRATYMAGLYNRLESGSGRRTVVNEDFVNMPNWLLLTFKIDAEGWFNPNKTEILEIERRLDLRNGLLTRKLTVEDEEGARP